VLIGMASRVNVLAGHVAAAEAPQFCLAEYVWRGGANDVFFAGLDLRSKTMTLDKLPADVKSYRVWNYDGSSTNQAPGNDSEVLLEPVAVFRDPFRRQGNNVLVLAAAKKASGGDAIDTYYECAKVMEGCKKEKPWFGIEQEYTLYRSDEKTPLGFPERGLPKPQGPYYCGAGTGCAIGRAIAEEHAEACLYAGVTISGINAEVMPGQWEFQVGPCEGIDSGNHLTIARYILLRICERHGVSVTFDPKPQTGDWNGTGCHTNYSTESMRQPGGIKAILDAIKKLGDKHQDHIRAYGEGNERRLTGLHETASIDKFSYGVADRGASIRIPRETDAKGCGYLEDRRPASNMDPYIVTGMLCKTTIL